MVKLRQLFEAEFINLLFFLIDYSHANAFLQKHSCPQKGKYEVCTLEQEKICHPLNKSDYLKIDSFDSSAIIVRPFSPISYGNKQCRFTIKAKHKDMGLFAVIQSMNFRKDSEGCVDYVQFRIKDNEQWSNKWCGEMNRLTSDSGIPHHFYSEYDPQGKLDTFIFISDEPIKPTEELNLSIVYTPNIKCSKVDRKNFRQVTHSVCIWKDYICDGFQNCAINGCDDEDECVRKIENDGTGTKVTVGAVTTIFLCFILFVTCLWICKKHKKLCWSADCAGPSANRAASNTDNERTPAPPTAPMLQTAVSSGVQDKDLPPSYDSLFPQQSNTAIL